MRTPARFSTACPFSTTGSNSHFSTALVAESTKVSPGSDPTTSTSLTLPSGDTVNTTSTQPEMLRRSADRGYRGATYFVRFSVLAATGDCWLTVAGSAAAC